MKRSLGVTAVLLAALLLAGCSSSGDDKPLDLPGGAPATSDQSGESATEGKAPVDGTTKDVKTANRDVITTGSVSITVDDPIKAAETAATITTQAGGRVDSRTENPGTDDAKSLGEDMGGYPIEPGPVPSANLTLRIPSDELDATLAELKKLGTVNFVSLNASDVTQQSRDLDARIATLTTGVDRLRTLLSQATTTADLIALEDALSTRQEKLESLQTERDYLSDQIDYSTITLALYAEGTIAPLAPDNFWSGIVAGWNALVGALGGALVGLGIAVPWLGAIALLGGIVLLIVWLSTRKGKAA